MRRILAVWTLAAVAVGVVSVSAARVTPVVAAGWPTPAGSYAGGSGTAGDPYLIANAARLVSLSATPAHCDKHFKQTAAISLAGCTWSPIGDTPAFTGSYNGDHKAITGLRVNTSNSNYGGFFGYAEGATLSAIHLANVSVSARDCSGGLLGYGGGVSISWVCRSCDFGSCDFGTCTGAGGWCVAGVGVWCEPGVDVGRGWPGECVG